MKTDLTHIGDTPSSFGAAFDPVFVWNIGDRLLLEAETEIEVSGDSTDLALEYANASYLLCDHSTFVAGKFLLPFATFSQRFHPGWINKLPDKPMAFADGGIAPESGLGVMLRGAFALQSTKLNYALYVINGPSLNLAPDVGQDGAPAGTLDFDNFTDNNSDKGIGGRFGVFPVSEVELGYSFLTAKVGSPDTSFSDVRSFLQAVDMTWIHDSDLLLGTIDVRAEWVWSSVDNADYGTTLAPLVFDNKRDGGYVQLAYRPDRVRQAVVRNLEGVVRYDALNQPDGAPSSVSEKRWTVGLNYWVNSTTVLKIAYRLDDMAEGDDANGVLAQVAVGF